MLFLRPAFRPAFYAAATATAVKGHACHLPVLRSITSGVWKSENPDAVFSVQLKNGFLPQVAPLKQLPAPFGDVEDILHKMPIHLKSGGNGLLAKGELGEYVLQNLKQHDVSGVRDPQLLTALFRDYSFLASAYLLEPSHNYMLKTGTYGVARDHLPASIAVPLDALGQKLGSFPFLDYAYGYALNNWAMVDERKPMDLDNLTMIRQFEGGTDESGFMLIHVAMVAKSKQQVNAVQQIALGAAKNNHAQLAEGLKMHRDFLADILKIFVGMWQASRPKGYNSFRTFIMGVVGNETIFPHGVLFEGVDTKPRQYRGETGAQDSMIPISDSILEMAYPHNHLTEYLMDLRAYRPKDHRAFVHWVAETSKHHQVKAKALQRSSTALPLLENLDIIRQIRAQHWNMTKAYIISFNKHPKATGGTPITTWLPNQLGGTLEYMEECCKEIHTLRAKGDKLAEADHARFLVLETNVQKHIAQLRDEVLGMQAQFGAEQEVGEFKKRAH